MSLAQQGSPGHSAHSLFSSGGYDESDVTFSWLRGNDSVQGLEGLRLSQYRLERYHTLVSRSRQETGTPGEKAGKALGASHPIASPPVGQHRLT